MVSRNRAKRKTRQRWYGCNKERLIKKAKLDYSENPEPKKLLIQKRYDENPEQKKTAERRRYGENPEQKKTAERRRYDKNPEQKKTAERRRYDENPEQKKTLQRRRYEVNPEQKKTVERWKYEENPEQKKKAERKRYEENREQKKTARRKRYENDPETEKMREQNKYRRDINSKKAKLIQSYRNYMKNIKQNLTTKNIKRRLPVLRYERKIQHSRSYSSRNKMLNHNKIGKCAKRNCLTLKWLSTHNIVKTLAKKIKNRTYANRLIEARSIIKWCIYAHITLKRNFLKKFAAVKNHCDEKIEKLLESKPLSEQMETACGQSRHTSSSEPFFYESSYKVFRNSNKKLILDESSAVINIFKDFEILRSKKSNNYTWKCTDDLCAIDNHYVLEKIKKCYTCINDMKLVNAPKFFSKINKCSHELEAKMINRKHIPRCYTHRGCESWIVFLRSIGPHFPLIRNFLRTLYALRKLSTHLTSLSEALRSENYNYLKTLADETSNKAKTFIVNDNSEENIIESQIEKKYINAIKQFHARCSDFPIHPCISCDKLFFEHQICDLAGLKKPIESTWWNQLLDIKHNEIKSGKICDGCIKKFRENKLPPACILNNLHFTAQPEEILRLNGYEKVLIQRAKAFQVVTRMETVANKMVPVHSKIQKVKGRTFHLPLPLEETLKKLPRPEDPFNLSQEIYILVRGTPTKSKIIWQSMVDINKVYAALRYFKSENVLYKKIELPDNARELLHFVDPNGVQVLQNNDENQNFPERRHALLTQVNTETWEGGYEEFTILALYDKRINATDCDLYQMLKVQEEPIDNSCKDIDDLCFPDLFFNGKFGQFTERKVKLSSAEFIKSRLLSKYSYFRLNQQYLFFLLHDSNIRQLQRGIFHKLNVAKLKERLTADACLQNISDGNLEGNLTTIFSNLRNTPQYWTRPRNDVACMVQHYGPATWFLTMSPSEWNWDDLRSYLIKVNNEITEIEKKSTSELIALDPVSVSRFIDNKFRAMLDFILSIDHPLGKVSHYFYRREYQGRGLQHFHLLLWVEDAPVLGNCTNEEVAKFIVKYVTCEMPIRKLAPTLYERVDKYQKHRHNSYCLRNKKTKFGFRQMCRFGFPRPVSDSLHLRDVVEAVVSRKNLQSKGRLYDLKRNAREQYINDYNPAILLVWDGNVDLQFIGEKSTILNWYITKYTTKSENSHIKDMFNDINSTKSVSSKLFSLGLRLLNSRECGALEASDTLLGIPLYGTDPETTIKWLDVNMHRRKRLLPINNIKNLKGNSTQIFFQSWVDDHYPNRPKELEDISLYEFSRLYDIKSSPLTKDKRETYKIGSKYLIRRKRPHLINHYKFSFHQTPEKYFYSLLLLFQPWRDTKDLKGSFETYAEAFASCKGILLNAAMYDKKMQELQVAFEHAKESIEMKRKQIESEEVKEAEGPEAGEGFLSKDAGDAMLDMRIAAAKTLASNHKSPDIEKIINLLNDDQKRVFRYVTKAVCDDSESKQVLRYYVSGVGGTGKSHLIHNLRIWIRNKIPGGIVSVSAPTGLSAHNISGITIYRQFQLPVEHGRTPKYRPLSNDVLKLMREELKDVVLFIIDEISMVSNLTLLYIHLRLSEIFATNDISDGWFGKKNILLFGDLLQLPPVHEDPPYLDISSELISKCVGSVLATNIWVKLFRYDELTINMRQAHDLEYAKILERLRIGNLTAEDIKMLQNRLIPMTSPSAHGRLKDLGDYLATLPFETVCLCATGHQCVSLNQEMLSRLDGNEVALVARDSVDCRPYMKKKVDKLLQDFRTDCSRTAGMEKVITIKVGAKIMLRRNIDLTKGLVNSAIGMVTEIKYGLDDDVDKVVIRFSDGLLHSLERVTTKFEILDKCFVFRKQFPITLSYGITIHKSQGLSLNTAVIDIGESVFSCAQSYVALSRVISIKGLHLINFNPANVKSLKTAIEEYNRLRTIYRSDLPLLGQENNGGLTYCRDRTWSTREVDVTHDDLPTSSKINTTKNKNRNKRPHTVSLRITGFANDDNVSCYANSVIQCLYSFEEVKNLIKVNSEIPEELKTNLCVYENGVIGSTVQIRSYIGDIFSEIQQQDAILFMECLFEKCPSFQPLFNFLTLQTSMCQNCRNSNTTEVCDRILRIPLKRNLKTLPELISASFGHWGPCLEDYRCETCKITGTVCQKFDITSASEYVVIQFKIYDNTLNKITDFKLNNAQKSRVQFGEAIYSPVAAIFHHGTRLSEGHYNSFIRNGTKWLCANDAIVENKSWPTSSKNIYALIMKKL